MTTHISMWYHVKYHDETFFLLEEDGARVISREELIGLIGENPYTYVGEYGEAYTLVE